MDILVFILAILIMLTVLTRELVNSWLKHKEACYRVDNDYRQATSYWEKIYKYLQEQDKVNQRILTALEPKLEKGLQVVNTVDASIIDEYLTGHQMTKLHIEAGNYSDRAAELRITLSQPVPTGHGDFYIPFSSHTGTALGWMRFSFITISQGATLFGATEWRPAHSPAPAEQDLLPLPVAYVPAGFAPPL